MARPWRFSDQSVPLFNFGNSLVPYVQRLDGNPTVGRLSWNMSEKTPARNFCATINNLSNQFFFTFNSRIILEPVHWTCLSLSLSLSCASTNTKTFPRTISQTCKSSWTLFNFYSYFAKFPLKKLLRKWVDLSTLWTPRRGWRALGPNIIFPHMWALGMLHRGNGLTRGKQGRWSSLWLPS